MERILELTKTGKDGTNFHNMSLAGLELGMMSKGYFIDNINDLDNIEKPFISQIVINNYHHFVVVYKINGEKITIMDPAKGMENISISEFLKIFTGYILIMEPIKKLPIYNDNNYLLNTIKEINDELHDKADLIIEGKLEFDRCESINIGSENNPLILEYNIYKIILN